MYHRRIQDFPEGQGANPKEGGASLLLPAATKLGQGNIFTSVCLSTGGGGVWSRGVSNFLGVSKFSGGLQFFGGSPNFFFFQIFPQNFFWDAPTPPPETVNARPVRILLECILILQKFLQNYMKRKKIVGGGLRV